MSMPSLEVPEFLPPQTLPAGRLQALGSGTESFESGITASTSPNLGTGGIAVGRWWQSGPEINFDIFIQFGTSGVSNGSGTYRIILPPIVPDGTFDAISYGPAAMRDDSPVTLRNGTAQTSPTDSDTRLTIATDAGVVTHSTPWTWAANDRIVITGRYIFAT